MLGEFLCVWAQDTHLKAADPVMWDRVYYGTHKHGTALFWGVVGGHSNTLDKTRDLLLTGYLGNAEFLSHDSHFGRSGLSKRAELQLQGADSLSR